MSGMLVPDIGTIIEGRGLKTGRQLFTPSTGDAERWGRLFATDAMAQTVAGVTEVPAEFYSICGDLIYAIPEREQEDAFFALKNGFVVPGVPGALIYFVQKIWEMDKIANRIVPQLPKYILSKISNFSYLGPGITLRDVICNFACKDFNPITPGRTTVKCGDWYESYIEELNEVVALPSPEALATVSMPGGKFKYDYR